MERQRTLSVWDSWAQALNYSPIAAERTEASLVWRPASTETDNLDKVLQSPEVCNDNYAADNGVRTVVSLTA